MRKLRNIPLVDRPREKLARLGASSLSDVELLAVVLGSGTLAQDVSFLSKKVLNLLDREREKVSFTSLKSIPGIGTAKAAQIVAASEFFRRRASPSGLRISSPGEVLPLVGHLLEKKQEHFVCISLNGAMEVIAIRVVTIGLVNTTQVHPREVFADPIMDRASSIIVAHNHPAEVLEPSKADQEVTEQLREAGKLLGIRLLDHVIFCSKGYYSFLENEKL